jgi:hypothetical protein
MGFFKQVGRALMGGRGTREYVQDVIVGAPQVRMKILDLFGDIEQAMSEDNRVKAVILLQELKREILG